MEKTKLNEILTSGMDEDDDPATLRWLTDPAKGTIEVRTVSHPPELDPYEPPTEKRPSLSVAQFDRGLDYEWRRASFTSLSPDHPIAAGRDTDEEPQREDETVDVETDELVAADLPMPMAALPSGAAFGTLVHHIFENVAFDTDDLGDRRACRSGEGGAPSLVGSRRRCPGLRDRRLDRDTARTWRR